MAENLEKELREQNRLLRQQLSLQDAKLEVLLQQVSAKSEPERLQLLEKQAILAKKQAVREEALSVAKSLAKGKEKITHVRYVTGSFYHRKGVLYPAGTVLKIPVTELPARDWKPWAPARITRPTAVDPDAAIPFGDLRASTSAISAVKRDEVSQLAAAAARGDAIISTGLPDTTPDQGEVQPEQAPPTEPGPEAGALSNTRASDTDVG
jgi:hypothetical protein